MLSSWDVLLRLLPLVQLTGEEAGLTGTSSLPPPRDVFSGSTARSDILFLRLQLISHSMDRVSTLVGTKRGKHWIALILLHQPNGSILRARWHLLWPQLWLMATTVLQPEWRECWSSQPTDPLFPLYVILIDEWRTVNLRQCWDVSSKSIVFHFILGPGFPSHQIPRQIEMWKPVCVLSH